MIRIVYILAAPAVGKTLLAVEWGRVGGCEQEGKVAQAKKVEEDLPQGAGAPSQGGLQQVSSPGGDMMR